MTRPAPRESGISIGLIGFGRMGRVHDRVLREMPGVSVTRLYDPEVSVFDDPRASDRPEDVLSDSTIGAIYVSTPNNVTTRMVLGALAAGKHVFSEKPLGFSAAEARQIAEAAAARPDQVFKVGFNHRYLSHYQEARRRIFNGEFGRLLWVRGRYGKGSDDNYLHSWRANTAVSGGGILLDQGIHMLDLIMDLVGRDFTEVKALCMSNRWAEMACEDNAFVLLHTPDGVAASMHSTLTQYKHLFCLEIGLEHGLLEVSGVLSSTKSYGQETLKVFFDWNNNSCREEVREFHNEDFYSVKAENEDFINCIRQGRQPTIGTAAEGVSVYELIERIYAEGGLATPAPARAPAPFVQPT